MDAATAQQLMNHAYQGDWRALFALLAQHPTLVNHVSPGKGYSALHQAAWHGADLAVVGRLLRAGADVSLKTSAQQTACDIAQQRHPQREDLRFVLDPAGRTLAQLMRKLVADQPPTLTYPDMLLLDNLLMLLSEEEGMAPDASAQARFTAAFFALSGRELAAPSQPHPSIPPNWWVDTDYWRERFLPALLALEQQKFTLPLAASWATVGDLLIVENASWGLRGDPWLWRELRKATARLPLPSTREELSGQLQKLVLALVGVAEFTDAYQHVPRFSRGGMSSGMVDLRFWQEKGIPLMVQRAEWLRAVSCGDALKQP